MPRIVIDKREHEVASGRNLLEVVLELGYDLPYFCWHPALGSVGACRQCAVKVYANEEDQRGRIVMACMTPLTDGMRVSLSDPDAVEFRAAIIQWLMTNHPHDCPVCDEGGECHLQDMTVMTGHVKRETRFPKKTFPDQDLGPFIHHEANRCIQCFRCVRFYGDFAGGNDLAPFASRDRTWFGRFEDGKLESHFSGNLVEVCPTGVFTDKTMRRHYTRKWDLQSAPSICSHCSLGCNTIVSERYGVVRRIRNRFNGTVNGYFLCDRGRFGYDHANHPERTRWPSIRKTRGEPGERMKTEAALAEVGRWLADGARVIGIGSPRASLESNFALREMVGPDRFCNGMAETEASLVRQALDILANRQDMVASLTQLAQADAVLVLGEDLSHTAPLAALAVRQASRQQALRKVDQARLPRWDDASARLVEGDDPGPVHVLHAWPTWLDRWARESRSAAPQDLTRLGLALLAKLQPDSPPEEDDFTADERAWAERVALDLGQAVHPVVVAGTSLGSPEILTLAARVADALDGPDRQAGLFLVLPEANSAGVGILEPAGLERASSLSAAGADVLLVLENDLFRHLPGPEVDALLGGVGRLVVIDHLANPTAALADLLLPAATFAESSGTLVNNELRAQRFFSAQPPGDEAAASWRWIERLAGRVDGGRLDAILGRLAADRGEFSALIGIAPDAQFRISGQRIPRQSHRFSGRTSMQAHLQVSEAGPSTDPDSALAYSMEGAQNPVPAALTTRYWAPGWNSVQAVNRAQERIGQRPSGGDPGQRIRLAQGRALPTLTMPGAFAGRPDRVLLLPRQTLFGSEELSSQATEIAQLTPPPTLFLGPETIAALGLVGDEALVKLDEAGTGLSVALRAEPGLPAGVGALISGLPGSAGLALPTWAEVVAP